jgi:hypothetical protein
MNLKISKRKGRCEMRNEQAFGTALRVISVLILVAAATGCASQGGGSKLDAQMMSRHTATSAEMIEVCNRNGAIISCSYEDKERVLDELEYQREMLRNDYRR